MTARLDLTINRVLDANGRPVPGARIHTYVAGTSTPKATYTDQARTTEAPNPIECDAGGLVPLVFLGRGAYKLVYTDAEGAEIRVDDAVPGDGDEERITYITPEQFGAAGDGETDDTAALQAALDSLAETGGALRLRRRYLVSGTLTIPGHCITIEGEARGSETGLAGAGLISATGDFDLIVAAGCHNLTLRDFTVSVAAGVTPTAGRVLHFVRGRFPVVERVDVYGFYDGFHFDGWNGARVADLDMLTGYGTFGLFFDEETNTGTNAKVNGLRIIPMHGTPVSGGGEPNYRAGFDGLRLRGASTVSVINTQLNRCERGLYTEPKSDGTRPAFLHLVAVTSEFSNYGFYLNSINRLHAVACEATLSHSDGWYIGGAGDGDVGEVHLVSCTAANGKGHGFVLDTRAGSGSGRGTILIVSCLASGNGNWGASDADGFVLRGGAESVRFLGGQSGGSGGTSNPTAVATQRYGINIEQATSRNIVVLGVDLRGNITAPLFNAAGAHPDVTIAFCPGLAAPVRLPSFTVSTLPPAAEWPQTLAYVSDGSNNRRLAVAVGGGVWRFPDGEVVS